jgi:sialic acid synthase SpsE
MIDSVTEIDSGEHEVIFKWQLFNEQGTNIPLRHDVFDAAYQHAAVLGYETTASVFDKGSIDFLLQYDVPFVKFACRPSLYPLVQHVPKHIPAYVSYPSFEGRMGKSRRVQPLACVPRYPAPLVAYQRNFKPSRIRQGVSDHTVGWDLLREYKPEIIEKHFVLERDENNPDAGPFAVTPDELAEVIGGSDEAW